MNYSLDGIDEQLLRKGRDMEPARQIESSQEEGDLLNNSSADEATLHYSDRKERQLLANLFYERTRTLTRMTTKTLTSIITSYSLSYSTTIVTNSNLAATQALNCVPSGYKICS